MKSCTLSSFSPGYVLCEHRQCCLACCQSDEVPVQHAWNPRGSAAKPSHAQHVSCTAAEKVNNHSSPAGHNLLLVPWFCAPAPQMALGVWMRSQSHEDCGISSAVPSNCCMLVCSASRCHVFVYVLVWMSPAGGGGLLLSHAGELVCSDCILCLLPGWLVYPCTCMLEQCTCRLAL